jgi:4-hydroxybenzoate polyprenyltransferase
MSSRWRVYFKERFPLIPNLLVALGITHTARILAERSMGVETGSLSTLMAVIGGMLFLAQIRLMDEYKDFEKDKIAHPDRPLPRGLFTHAEFGSWIARFNAAMILLSMLLGWIVNPVSGVLFAIGTLYLYLMFREFYVGEWLSKRPMLYAITHQLIIFPMGAFVYSCYQSQVLNDPQVFWFCLMLIGAFFGFEVGRKLDPSAHPILKTYLVQFGKPKTVTLLLVLLGISFHAGKHLAVDGILGALYILVILASSLVWWAPSRFKIVEGMVTLFLLLALWSVPLMSLLRSSQS